MKRSELDRRLRRVARENNAEWLFVREGGGHEIWSMNGRPVQLPRHNDVAERLARKIIADAAKAAREAR